MWAAGRTGHTGLYDTFVLRQFQPRARSANSVSARRAFQKPKVSTDVHRADATRTARNRHRDSTHPTGMHTMTRVRALAQKQNVNEKDFNRTVRRKSLKPSVSVA